VHLTACRREDGSIDKNAFKVVYVAPMKVRAGSLHAGLRLLPLPPTSPTK